MPRICCLLACVLTLGACLPAAEDPDSMAGTNEHAIKIFTGRTNASDLQAERIKLALQLRGNPNPTPDDRLLLRKLELLNNRAALKPAPKAVDAHDPADLYFQGWLLSRDASKLKEKNQHAARLEKLGRALDIFKQVAKDHPDWKPEMVKSRIASTEAEIALLKPAGK